MNTCFYFVVLVAYEIAISVNIPLKHIDGKLNNFVVTLCQAGSEKSLKSEISLNHPELRSAFSRPGMVTFKSPSEVSPNVHINSIFALAFFASIGPAKTMDDIIQAADYVSSMHGSRRLLRLHVCGRDEPGIASEHPSAIASAKERVNEVFQELLLRGKEGNFWINEEKISTPNYSPWENQAQLNDHVFDVIVPTGPYVSDPIFIGHHIHTIHHSPWSGGNSCLTLPSDAPSRAFLKLEETLLWGNPPIEKGDTALEIGSAPGGMSLALLRRGVNVIGVDPSPPDRQHSPIVANHPNFRLIKNRIQNVMKSQLPNEVNWIICDANISPQTSLPVIKPLVMAYRHCLKGVIINLKLGEENWNNIDIIRGFLKEIESMDNLQVKCAQLPSHRQEVVALGLTRRGQDLLKQRGI